MILFLFYKILSLGVLDTFRGICGGAGPYGFTVTTEACLVQQKTKKFSKFLVTSNLLTYA